MKQIWPLLLVSYQGLSLKFVWVGGHYQYTIILQQQKKFGFWTRKAMLPVKEVKSRSKRSGIFGSETSLAVLQFTSSKSTCKSAASTRTEREKYTIMASEVGPKKACGWRMRN